MSQQRFFTLSFKMWLNLTLENQTHSLILRVGHLTAEVFARPELPLAVFANKCGI